MCVLSATKRGMLEIVQLWRVGAKLICQGIKTKIYLKVGK